MVSQRASFLLGACRIKKMIFDRTENDIAEAKKIILSKVNSFDELTQDEIDILERGIITQNTINRIEQKEIELYDLFAKAGYYAPTIENKLWNNEKDFFKATDLERIINNGEVLREAFFVYSTTPEKANVKYDFSNINAIEKLLYDLQSMLEYVIANYRECDTFWCGEE